MSVQTSETAAICLDQLLPHSLLQNAPARTAPLGVRHVTCATRSDSTSPTGKTTTTRCRTKKSQRSEYLVLHAFVAPSCVFTSPTRTCSSPDLASDDHFKSTKVVLGCHDPGLLTFFGRTMRGAMQLRDAARYCVAGHLAPWTHGMQLHVCDTQGNL